MNNTKYCRQFESIFYDESGVPKRQLIKKLIEDEQLELTLDSLYRLYKKWRYYKFGPITQIREQLRNAITEPDLITDFAFMGNEVNPDFKIGRAHV